MAGCRQWQYKENVGVCTCDYQMRESYVQVYTYLRMYAWGRQILLKCTSVECMRTFTLGQDNHVCPKVQLEVFRIPQRIA